MPSVSKIEKETENSGGTDPFKQSITVIEHKIRNLEKRKVKLDQYKSEQDNGKQLNPDQLAAVAKYSEVIQQLDFSRDIFKQISQIGVDSAKALKKQQRKENAEKISLEMDKYKNLTIFRTLLDQLEKPEFKLHYVNGSQGAVKVSHEELNLLETISTQLTPKYPFQDKEEYLKKVNEAADIWFNILDGKPRVFSGKSYKEIKDLLESMSSFFLSYNPVVVQKETTTTNPTIATINRPRKSDPIPTMGEVVVTSGNNITKYESRQTSKSNNSNSGRHHQQNRVSHQMKNSHNRLNDNMQINDSQMINSNQPIKHQSNSTEEQQQPPQVVPINNHNEISNNSQRLSPNNMEQQVPIVKTNEEQIMQQMPPLTEHLLQKKHHSVVNSPKTSPTFVNSTSAPPTPHCPPRYEVITGEANTTVNYMQETHTIHTTSHSHVDPAVDPAIVAYAPQQMPANALQCNTLEQNVIYSAMEHMMKKNFPPSSVPHHPHSGVGYVGNVNWDQCANTHIVSPNDNNGEGNGGPDIFDRAAGSYRGPKYQSNRGYSNMTNQNGYRGNNMRGGSGGVYRGGYSGRNGYSATERGYRPDTGIRGEYNGRGGPRGGRGKYFESARGSGNRL